MSKTQILGIEELYNVVPTTKVLEGKNFKDIRELLNNLIEAIEQNGQWQFIQYVNNKPSLFIIRENESSEVEINNSTKKVNALIKKSETLYKKLNGIKVSQPQLSPNVPDEPYTNEEFTEISEEVKESTKPVFSTTLPWD